MRVRYIFKGKTSEEFSFKTFIQHLLFSIFEVKNNIRTSVIIIII